jgi:hypothetical protein
VQRQLAAKAEAGAAIGLPGAVAQRGSRNARGGKATKQLADEVERLSMVQTQAATAGRKLEDQHKAVALATSPRASRVRFSRPASCRCSARSIPSALRSRRDQRVLRMGICRERSRKAAKKVEDAQRQLATVIDFTTGKVREQNDVCLANARLSASAGIVAASQQQVPARRQIGSVLASRSLQSGVSEAGAPAEARAAGENTPGQKAFLRALDQASGMAAACRRSSGL